MTGRTPGWRFGAFRKRAAALDPDADAAFERLVNETFRALPPAFLDVCGPLVVRVDDFADDATLDMMDIDDPYGLLGLYHGIGLPFKSTGDVPHGPDVVSLYRLPILAFAEDEGLPVTRVVRHVLIHEIGHHFGFSDDDMDVIEDEG